MKGWKQTAHRMRMLSKKILLTLHRIFVNFWSSGTMGNLVIKGNSQVPERRRRTSKREKGRSPNLLKESIVLNVMDKAISKRNVLIIWDQRARHMPPLSVTQILPHLIWRIVMMKKGISQRSWLLLMLSLRRTWICLCKSLGSIVMKNSWEL